MTTKRKSVTFRPKKLSVAVQPKSPNYDKDFYAWIQVQTKLLRENNWEKIDIQNLIEEIESLGKKDKRALRSHLVILLMHLLKMKHQPNEISNSWKQSVSNARREIKLIIEDSPSLKNELPKILDSSYSDARLEAAEETEIKLKDFPKKCPWELKEILDPTFHL